MMIAAVMNNRRVMVIAWSFALHLREEERSMCCFQPGLPEVAIPFLKAESTPAFETRFVPAGSARFSGTSSHLLAGGENPDDGPTSRANKGSNRVTNLSCPAQRKTAEGEPSSGDYRIVTVVPAERQHALDHALEETFPASDPVSITITEVVRVKPQGGRND
jgi:hypothetical protein